MKKTLHTLLLALLIIPATGISLVSCSDEAVSESALPQITKKEARAQLKKKGIKKKQYDDALFTAACKGDCELLQLLIIAGANVNKSHSFTDSDGEELYRETTLAFVIKLNMRQGLKHQVIKTLLSAPDINPNVFVQLNDEPLYALEYAERQGMTEIADMLRAAGAK